jgi:hypothetical protein
MLYKYSRFFDVPVTEETAYIIINLTEGSPFYISAVIRSGYPDKDLTTIEGLSRVLAFETLDDEGIIKSTWMEYITSAFSRVNDLNAKKIVLHLSKYRDREWTRQELLEELKLDMTDSELEKKLKALVKSDIISQGQTNFDYRGVGDNIFDKVFRGVYEKEIREFDVKVIKEEYNEALGKLKKDYNSLLGKFNCRKGYYAEYEIIDQLQYGVRKNNDLFKSITRNLPVDFQFCDYSRVWHYDSWPGYAKKFNVDIFARAQRPGDYSIIGEVKSRDSRKFSLDEVMELERKLAEG